MRRSSPLNRTPLTGPSWCIGAPIGAPVAASQSRTVLSWDQDSMRRPSMLNRTPLTGPSWCIGAPIGAPVAASHTRAVLSPEAVTTCLPSGEKAALKTGPSWPLSTAIALPVAASHTRAVLSPEAVTTCLPSAEKAAEAAISLTKATSEPLETKSSRSTRPLRVSPRLQTAIMPPESTLAMRLLREEASFAMGLRPTLFSLALALTS